MTNLAQLEQSRDELIKKRDELESFRQQLIAKCEDLKQACQASTKVFKQRKADREILFEEIKRLVKNGETDKEFTYFKNQLIDESTRYFLPNDMLNVLNEFNDPEAIPDCQIYEQDLGSFLLALNLVALAKDTTVQMFSHGEEIYDNLSAIVDDLDPKLAAAVELLPEDDETVPTQLQEFMTLIKQQVAGETVQRYDSLKNEAKSASEKTPYFFLALTVFSSVDALIARLMLVRLAIKTLNEHMAKASQEG